MGTRPLTEETQAFPAG